MEPWKQAPPIQYAAHARGGQIAASALSNYVRMRIILSLYMQDRKNQWTIFISINTFIDIDKLN